MTAALHVVRLGELADHIRGRNLELALSAVAAEGPPAAGVVMVFGRDLQKDDDLARRLCGWAESPGRLLVIVPPFARGASELPAGWEACAAAPMAGGRSIVAQTLAAERRHQLKGAWLPLERIGAEVVTMGWRRHPAGGLVVITALPLWSLTLLDAKPACAAWLNELYDQAGTAGDEVSGAHPAMAEELGRNHWTVLLHWVTGPFDGDAEGLERLMRSPYFSIQNDAAREAVGELSRRALIDGGRLTDDGGELLMNGPYADYAAELRRMSHG